jgi:glutathione S-transferase
VCGDRFTMADVYLGSSVDWGMTFGILPPRESFVAYAERIQARPAYKAAKAVDNALIEQMRK